MAIFGTVETIVQKQGIDLGLEKGRQCIVGRQHQRLLFIVGRIQDQGHPRHLKKCRDQSVESGLALPADGLNPARAVGMHDCRESAIARRGGRGRPGA